MVRWVVRLARSARPGYPCERPTRDDVENWVKQVEEQGIRSIICLLDEEQLAYYELLELHPDGLLGFYRELGFEVCNIPIKDRPGCTDHITGDMLRRAVDAFHKMEPPVLVHCSAGVDRTGAVVQSILNSLSEGRDV